MSDGLVMVRWPGGYATASLRAMVVDHDKL